MNWDEGSEAQSTWHARWCKCGHLSVGHSNDEKGHCRLKGCKCQKFVEGISPFYSKDNDEPVVTKPVKAEPAKQEDKPNKVLKPGKPLVKRKK